MRFRCGLHGLFGTGAEVDLECVGLKEVFKRMRHAFDTQRSFNYVWFMHVHVGFKAALISFGINFGMWFGIRGGRCGYLAQAANATPPRRHGWTGEQPRKWAGLGSSTVRCPA